MLFGENGSFFIIPCPVVGMKDDVRIPLAGLHFVQLLWQCLVYSGRNVERCDVSMMGIYYVLLEVVFLKDAHMGEAVIPGKRLALICPSSGNP